ncbi:MAG: tripartite tricarboxylate transporter substrate binding protein BugD, partial [Xanthobacteraceae bacterium]
MRILVQSLVLTLSTLSTFAHAQDFPTKPVTIVNPLTAGTGVDVMTRLYADAVARDTGQRILVENKTGSGG